MSKNSEIKTIAKRKWDAVRYSENHEEPERAQKDLTDLFVDAPLTDEESQCDTDSDSEESTNSEADKLQDKQKQENYDSSDSDSSEYSELNESDTSEDSSSDSEEVLYQIADQRHKDRLPNDSADPVVAVATECTTGSSVDSSDNQFAIKPDPTEYEIDSSDEEDVRNTIGNVPHEWYKDYPHLGYDWQGKRILKPATGDELDKFLKRMDDPDFWRTVRDKTTGQDVVLTDEDLDILQKIQQQKLPVQGDPYEEFNDSFIRDTMKTSLDSRPPSKRSFIPSLSDKEKISKLVHAIKMGWITTKPQTVNETLPEDREEVFYSLWEKEEEDSVSKSQRARKLNHVPAPKLVLPGHAESYNPPPEYLLTEEEKEKRRLQDPEDRQLNFVPRQYKAMRLIPGFYRFVKERFERCLDLYLCPRQRKMKVDIDPDDLIPKLPKPKDLQPFPTSEAITYTGHAGIVRSLSVHSEGQFFVSGSDDCTVKVWEVSTGRCFRTFQLHTKVTCVSWLPKSDICLFAAVSGKDVWFINPEIGDKLAWSNTDHLLENLGTPDSASVIASFRNATESEFKNGFRLKLTHAQEVKMITWHPKGDYFATIAGDGPTSKVVMHQLSKLRSQIPFKKLSMVESILFHPLKPFFFVCTQRSVRIYDLSKQELKKSLQPSCKFISSAAIHPGGDNIIVGSYDHKLCWFDLDSSVRPYQTLRNHNKAIRQVTFHRKYPLFASAADDGSVIVCHGMVYNDLNQFPLIVPVKVLKNHAIDLENGLGVLDIQFHPVQPWIFSAGADRTIRLYV